MSAALQVQEVHGSMSYNDLNVYCLAHIFSFLPVADRIRLQRVSKTWQEASKISLSQLTKLECFYHLNPSYCEKHLNYRRCRSMSLQKLEKVLPLCGNSLKHFRCFTMYGPNMMVSDIAFFKLLMETCPNLEILDIAEMKLSSEGLQFAANHYNNFTDLRVSIIHDDTLNDAMVKLFASTKRLSVLELECVNMIPECLEKVPAETLESMTIKLEYGNSPEETVQAIKNCPKLHTLRIDCGQRERNYHSILNAILENDRQRNFKILSITGVSYGYMDNALLIATFTNLQSLTLDIGDNLDDRILRNIGNNCELLSSLTLYDKAEGPQCITDKGLTKFTNLKHLKLKGVNLVVGACFKRMTELESVELSRCEGIGNYGLRVLFKSAKNLKYLELLDEDSKHYIDYMRAVPKTRANKVPLKIRLVLFDSGEDSCVYRDGYLSVEEYHLR